RGHFHGLTGTQLDAGRVERSLAKGWTVGNRTYVAFITPAINRAYEQVNFMVAAVNGTPSNMDVAIYVTDENKILTSQIGVHRVEGVGLGDELVSVTFQHGWRRRAPTSRSQCDSTPRALSAPYWGCMTPRAHCRTWYSRARSPHTVTRLRRRSLRRWTVKPSWTSRPTGSSPTSNYPRPG